MSTVPLHWETENEIVWLGHLTQMHTNQIASQMLCKQVIQIQNLMKDQEKVWIDGIAEI
jgi:hypothetical protein